MRGHGVKKLYEKLSAYVIADLGQYQSAVVDLPTAEQLDCVWASPNGPSACFEVEWSTSMTSDLMRGSNLLGGVRRSLVIPEERRVQLANKQKSPLFGERWEKDGWTVLYFDHLMDGWNRLRKARGRFSDLEGFDEKSDVVSQPKQLPFDIS